MEEQKKPFSWKDVEGFFHEPEVYLLQNMIKMFPKGSYVEVGSWKGKSIIAVLPSLINADYQTIVCVDTWKGSDNEIFEKDGKPGPHHEARQRDIFEDFEANIAKTGYAERIEAYKMPSIEAATHFENNSLDIVFLDGNHTFENVNQDIGVWWPKVKVGSYLCGHDASFEAVYAAVNFNFRPGTWIIANNCWTARKWM